MAATAAPATAATAAPTTADERPTHAHGSHHPTATLLAPNVLSVSHWNRLHEGALYAASPRIDWSDLLRRTFDVDVLECARCRGRLRVLAQITDAYVARRILRAVGAPTEAPVAASARDPTELDPLVGVI